MATTAPSRAINVWEDSGHKFEIAGDFHLGVFLTAVSYNADPTYDPLSIRAKGELDFKFGGAINDDLSYGFKIELRPDPTIDEYYATLKSKRFGSIYVGTTKSPASKRHVRAPEFYAQDLNAIEGQDFRPLSRIGSNAGHFNAAHFNVKDETDIDYDEDVHKIIYYTPRLGGFEFGISYAPDIGTNGRGNDDNSLENTSGLIPQNEASGNVSRKDAISASINYKARSGGVGFATSGGYFYTRAIGASDPSAWSVGIELDLPLGSNRLKLGGGYLNSKNAKAGARDEDIVIIGTAFEADDWKAGIHYRYGEENHTGNDDRKVSELEFGGSYAFNQYLKLSSGIELGVSEVEGFENAEALVFNVVLTLNF